MSKITLDDLAIIIADEFSANAKRIDSIEKKLDSHSTKLDSNDIRFDSLEKKINNLAIGQNRILDILLNNTPSRSEERELDRRVFKLENHLKLA